MRYAPKKDRSSFTKMQRHEQRQETLKKRLSGTGRYKFKNNTTGDLSLPKPAEDGRTAVKHKGEFIGDSYFLGMVPSMLIVVEDYGMSDKLITEQPPTVTTEGKVEYVQQGQKLNESKPGQKQPDVLLTEDPAGGVVVLE